MRASEHDLERPKRRALELRDRYAAVRAATLALCEPLAPEDYVLQSMPECSPVKWHLAHTTWFFEVFVLRELDPDYACPRGYERLFNSYYEALGARISRDARGLLSRPTIDEIRVYRARVDDAVCALLSRAEPPRADLLARVELGLAHEEQHQELLLTDLLHAFSKNPIEPIYRAAPEALSRACSVVHEEPRGEAHRWCDEPGGVLRVGRTGDGLAFDNEGPLHRAFVEPFSLRSERVTCAEYIEFIRDGGYREPRLWLADGYAFITSRAIEAPEYWTREGESFSRFTLYGRLPVDPHAPVTHLSYYEADAFARWVQARLPSEVEWEVSARRASHAGQHVEDGLFVCSRASVNETMGGAWTWTSSAYSAYPGFVAQAGALGEYNGKFMSGQMVLRGSSCFTPRAHARVTYRNFFAPHTRFQVSSLRLARSVSRAS